MKKLEVFIDRYLSENSDKRYYYLIFSFLFCIVTFFCYIHFIVYGKSLIWGYDGYQQHFKALVYYGRYLRRILGNLIINHQLVIKHWDFNISEGADILSTLHYYVIGDPLTLFSVFVPTKYMMGLYNVLCIVRLYLSGLAFSHLCFETKQKNKIAILSGAIAYSLSAWGIYVAVRHPYFANPLIYFPLIILGIEKIINNKKPFIFILSIFVSAMSNMYFFYMLALVSVIYTVVRLILLYKKDVKQIFLKLIYMFFMAVLAICMAGFIFFPVIKIFFSDSRIGNSQVFLWIYEMEYYKKIFALFLNSDVNNWLTIGFTSTVMLASFYLFIKKKNTLLKILFVLSLIFALSPIFGRVLSGMLYSTNRWIWAFTLLGSYILVKVFEELCSIKKKEFIKLFLLSILYYLAILFFEESRIKSALFVIPAFFINLIIIAYDFGLENSKIKKQVALLLLVCLGVVGVSFYTYSPQEESYLNQFVDSFEFIEKKWESNETKVVKAYSNETYPRYATSEQNFDYNFGFVNDISELSYFFSISNPYSSLYRRKLGLIGGLGLFQYLGNNNRTTPITLSAASYYVSKEGYKDLPYGYEYIGSMNVNAALEEKYQGDLKRELGIEKLSDIQLRDLHNMYGNTYDIYKNKYALPLGYTYDKYISSDKWEELNIAQKQEIMLDAVVLEKDIKDIKKFENQIKAYEVPFSLINVSEDIIKEGNTFNILNNNVSIDLKLNKDTKDKEVYLSLEGIKYEYKDDYSKYFGDDLKADPIKKFNRIYFNTLSPRHRYSIKKFKKSYLNPINIGFILKHDEKEQHIKHETDVDVFYAGIEDRVINLGWKEKNLEKINFKFERQGIHKFKNIKVYAIPKDEFGSKIENLKKDTLKDLYLGTDEIKGNIELSSPKILCMAIPYSKGWKVFVNNKESELLLVNKHYMGVKLDKGYSDVYFKYELPFERLGYLISAVSMVIFIGLCAFYRRKDMNGGDLNG